jgi:hypothetical protein
VLVAILVLLVVLWVLGYVNVPSFVVPDIPLFAINGHMVTLVEGLIFLVLLAAAGMLPTPLRQIAFVAMVLWVLSTLGIVAITGLSSILVIAVIVGLIASLFGLIGRPRETVTVVREDVQY